VVPPVMGDENASARWLAVHDELLRGIAHALSNRIATLAATVYMYEAGDVPPETVMESVRTETARMETVLGLLRALPERRHAEPEPATANEACALAVSLHAHHPDFRDVACDIVVDAAVYPIWAEPHAMCHALLVALTTAKRHASADGTIKVRVTGTADVVQFRVHATPGIGESDAASEHDAKAATWLLERHGGTARVVPDGCALEVPTLVAARRVRKP
jgi:hypothetical protein